MRILIIGLGIYGANLATDLTALGHEVIGADTNPQIVESIKEQITTAYVVDSTEEAALEVLPLNNVNLVIVAIGENFGASIKTVALLKKLGVKNIYARAIDPLHESILQGIGVDRILTPEQRAAFDLVNEMSLGCNVDAMKVDSVNYVLKFRAPQIMCGLEYANMNLEKEYGFRLVAVTRRVNERNIIGQQHATERYLSPSEYRGSLVVASDIWTCFGPLKKILAIAPQ